MATSLTLQSGAAARASLTLHPEAIVFAVVSGSHYYGLASPASDVDVHGMHRLSARQLLSLHPGQETIEIRQNGEIRQYGPDAPQVDLVTHDAGKYLKLLLKGTGWALEDLYSPHLLQTGPAHKVLQRLATGCITLRLKHYYQGMAFTQFKQMRGNPVKSLLHVYRCLLTGMHVLRTGDLVTDLRWLIQHYRDASLVGPVGSLIDLKLSSTGPVALDAEALEHHGHLKTSLERELQEAADASRLPGVPTRETEEALNEWLVQLRLESL